MFAFCRVHNHTQPTFFGATSKRYDFFISSTCRLGSKPYYLGHVETPDQMTSYTLFLGRSSENPRFYMAEINPITDQDQVARSASGFQAGSTFLVLHPL